MRELKDLVLTKRRELNYPATAFTQPCSPSALLLEVFVFYQNVP